MKVGIPRALLYHSYHPFINSFFTELGAEIILSPETNKQVLNLGVQHCIDEACLPIKVFHGHVASIKDQCDIILLPRIMQLRKGEFICPKFCGLPEMVLNSIPSLCKAITEPIYSYSEKSFNIFVKNTGHLFTNNSLTIEKAYKSALNAQRSYKGGIKDEGYDLTVALMGHPYNVYDKFSNMDVVKKLNNLGIGIITEDNVDSASIDLQVRNLYKKPFWSFVRNSYGSSTYLAENNKINGIVYVSSFACGIDSVLTELIKDRLGDFPILILKIDEQTGEAGLDTRLEAFVDMLERRCS